MKFIKLSFISFGLLQLFSFQNLSANPISLPVFSTKEKARIIRSIREALNDEKYLSSSGKKMNVMISGNKIVLSGKVEDEKEIPLIEVKIHNIERRFILVENIKVKSE